MGGVKGLKVWLCWLGQFFGQAQVAQAESVVEGLQTQLWQGVFDFSMFIAGVEGACAMRGVAVPTISEADGQAMFDTALRLNEQWRQVPVKAEFTLAFPLALLLRMERFAPLRLIGLLLGLSAVALLAAPGAALPDPAMAAFLPVALIGPLFYAVEGIYVARRGMGGMDAIQAMFGSSIVGLVFCTPVMLASTAELTCCEVLA